jgi:hypothetical protein
LLWARAQRGTAWAGASDGFAARGGIHDPQQSPAQSRVFLYDVQPTPRPLRAGDVLSHGDEVALAYENGSSKSRLMVFGVDEHSHVYWFYPAWTQQTDDPVAVPIATDSERHELPDAIRHKFDGTSLEVHALFTDSPLTVREVEAAVAKSSGPLSLPGTVETTTRIAVAP